MQASGSGRVQVVMCLWKRPHLLEFNLHQLASQEGDYELHLWNNNSDATVRHSIDESARSFPDLVTSVVHSPVNLGGWARFQVASHLREQGHRQVMFLDDDILLAPGTLKRLQSHAAPRTIASLWAFTIHGPDYWDRTPTPEGEVANYCGTGGMLADTAIFDTPALRRVPSSIRWVEDLWLSYVAQHELGWRLESAGHRGFSVREDGLDQGVGRTSDKSEAFSLLRQRGWLNNLGDAGPAANGCSRDSVE